MANNSIVVYTVLQLTPLSELSVPRRSTTAPAPAGPATSGALMSPYQFAHSSTAAVAADHTHTEMEEGSKDVKKEAEQESLSKEQLQQALLYLIKVCKAHS